MTEKKNNKAVIITIISLSVIFIIGIILFIFISFKNKDSNYVEIDKQSTNLNIEYSNEELTGEYAQYAAKILLDDAKITIEGSGVTNSENTIKITSGGSYYITGSISDGNILVEAEKQDVQLVLDNASITSKTTAPINGVTGSKLTITLLENSINTITDNESYTTFTDTESLEPDGAIFTKTDLIINGTGKLIVNANYLDGIVSKDGVKIINSNIEVTSKDDGIRGKDYVAINNGNIKVTSEGDGIKTTNDTDANLGYIAIEGGTFDINSNADGIQAQTILNISSEANIKITTTGEIASTNQNQDFMNRPGGFGFENNTTTTTEDTASSKALKAGEEITIENGSIEITSTDDSIHSNGIIIINGGTINLSSSDDGIHADTNIVIDNASINVSKSYEGIESGYIEINGGEISVIASDDGVNISGGNDNSAMGGRIGQNNFSQIEDSNKKLVINGGYLTVNADGDGLDSNGGIYINGGNIIVAGPKSGGNGVLDYTSECVVTSGTVFIYGGTDMWQNPSNSSTQYTVTFNATGNSGDEVVLKDSKGNEIVKVETVKSYGAVCISDSKIIKGETYYLYINGTKEAEITVSDIVTSTISSSNPFNNSGNQGGMQQPGGMQQQMQGKRR